MTTGEFRRFYRQSYLDTLGGGTTGGASGGGTGTVTAWTAPTGYTAVFEDQFLASTVDATKWGINSEGASYGSTNGSTGVWTAGNVAAGVADSGATGGKALKLYARKSGSTYTCGMLASKGANYFIPRYHYTEMRLRIPHAQGIWPAAWFTGKSGGASVIEFDGMEYFHSQIPGKFSVTQWSKTSAGQANPTQVWTNNGANGAGRILFETPTDTPQFHVFAWEVVPVTDSTGSTIGDLTQPSQYVRFRTYLDGVQVTQHVDSNATYWTTNAGTTDSFWNIFLQGSQMEGNYVGDIAGPLGYSSSYANSHAGNGCFNGGTSPNACTVPTGARLADFATAGSDARYAFTVDYVRVAKRTS